MGQIHHPYNGIFPIPQETIALECDFLVDASTLIIVPENASKYDLFLAHFLSAELSHRYGLGLATKRVSVIPVINTYFLIGSMANPLVQAWCLENDSDALMQNTEPEGYVLQIHDRYAVIAGYDEQGAFFGLQSLRQLFKPANKEASLHIPGVFIRD